MDPIGRGMRYGLIRPIQAERHRNKTVQPQKGGPHGCRAGERRQKLSILRFLAHFREELTIVLATASSDAVLPQIMRKLEWMGESPPSSGWSCRPDIRSTWMRSRST
jgi:hypothetical protein